MFESRVIPQRAAGDYAFLMQFLLPGTPSSPYLLSETLTSPVNPTRSVCNIPCDRFIPRSSNFSLTGAHITTITAYLTLYDSSVSTRGPPPTGLWSFWKQRPPFPFQSTQYGIQWSTMNALKCLLKERTNVDKQKVIIVRTALRI